MTEKLYYETPYLREFTADIEEILEIEQGCKIQLSRTAFYPEGGGQPGDKGFIEGIEVYDVQKKDGKIFHFLKSIPQNKTVTAQIDWQHRFEYMQQHTGQHILSALLKKVENSNTVAVHQAEDYTSIEVDHNNPIDIEKIEELANLIVCKNLPVHCFFNGQREISDFPIRRETIHSENVRLVQLGGNTLETAEKKELDEASIVISNSLDIETIDLLDLAACGGVHTGTTGEVGLVKFIAFEKVRGRRRLVWLIGKRAYSDYRKKTQITDKIKESLSIPLDEMEAEFDRFVKSFGEEKKKYSDLLKEVAKDKAKSLYEEIKNGKNTFVFLDLEPFFFKKIITCLSLYENIQVCLINRQGNEGLWALLSTGNTPMDFQSFQKNLLPIIEGKGGGKLPLWQGKLTQTENVDQFEKAFSDSLS